MGKLREAGKAFWAWASHASLAQWLLTPLWGQITAAVSATWIVIDAGLRELPPALTVPAGLATYVLVLAAIDATLHLWKRWFQKEAALTRLWQLRSFGISLRNRELAGEEEYHAWKQELEVWLAQVYEQTGKINPNLRAYVERLDRTRPAPVMRVVNSEHARWVRIASEVLSRLQEYLQGQLHRG